MSNTREPRARDRTSKKHPCFNLPALVAPAALEGHPSKRLGEAPLISAAFRAGAAVERYIRDPGVCIPVGLPARPSVCLSVGLSVCQFACPSAGRSVGFVQRYFPEESGTQRHGPRISKHYKT